MHNHVYAVILAGGGGTRLWPKSRQQTPKQFLRLYGDKTMLELTADRLNQLVPWERMIVVTNQAYLATVKELLPNLKPENILAEPQKRDTALAMLLGALYARSLDSEAVILNAAADHIVQDTTEYVRVMQAAASEATAQPLLITVGISPTYPSTGFGYIKIDGEIKRLNKNLASFAVDNFTEKPNRATARAFLATGRYFWNANMYVWKAQTLLDTFARYQPEMHQLIEPLLKASSKIIQASLKTLYSDFPTISIDYAISEKADNLILIPGDFGWNDIGEWRVVYELSKQDPAGNVLLSDTKLGDAKPLLLESHQNLVYAHQRKVVLLGVDDMLVIDTPDALLIAPRQQSQNIKKVVTALQDQQLDSYL